MGWLGRLFGGGKSSEKESEMPAKSLEYNGYVINAQPYKATGGWQLAGQISKAGRVHKFVRADQFGSAAEAADFALAKGKLIVDQLGEAMFN